MSRFLFASFFLVLILLVRPVAQSNREHTSTDVGRPFSNPTTVRPDPDPPLRSFTDQQRVRGKVTDIYDDSFQLLTPEGKGMFFTVDPRTSVLRKKGPLVVNPQWQTQFKTLIQSGDIVDVHYHDFGGTTHASHIQELSGWSDAGPFKLPTPSVSATPSISTNPTVPVSAPSHTPPSTYAPQPSIDNSKLRAVIPVFYATDRNRSSVTPLTYGSSRDGADRLHLGRFDVTIPRDHRMGDVERPNIWSFWTEDPARHLTFVGRSELGYGDFYSGISAVLSKSQATEKAVFVFIHGFNVSFEDAVYQTAQMAYDLSFDGAPILYSWPSVHELIDYRIDEKNNDWTVEHLRWFLEDVRAKSGAQVVHLIAHSMGNRPLVRALDAMASVPSSPNTRARLGEIVLTAPDVDAGFFSQIARRLTTRGKRMTLYASGNDVALEAAHKYDTFQRAGDTMPQVVVLPGIDTIDASLVQTGYVNHSYFRENRSVISDLYYLIRGTAASARFSIASVGAPPRSYYAFKQ